MFDNIYNEVATGKNWLHYFNTFTEFLSFLELTKKAFVHLTASVRVKGKYNDNHISFN